MEGKLSIDDITVYVRWWEGKEETGKKQHDKETSNLRRSNGQTDSF